MNPTISYKELTSATWSKILHALAEDRSFIYVKGEHLSISPSGEISNEGCEKLWILGILKIYESCSATWSKMLHAAAEGSSFISVKGEHLSISPLDKISSEGCEKLSIQEIVRISKSCLDQDDINFKTMIKIKLDTSTLIDVESGKLKEIIDKVNAEDVQQEIKKLNESKDLFKITDDEQVRKRREDLERIGVYEIKEEKELIEIAKIAAAQEGERTSRDIEFYGIKDEKARIEIAKIAAAQSGYGTSQSIKKYGIRNEKELVEIAKIAAAQNVYGTSEYIKEYGIRNEKELVEIAKIAAAQDGDGISKFIHNYGIKDQKELVEIAKIAAAQDGDGMSFFIQNYAIKDEKARIEIAKIAAAQKYSGISEFIQNYGIKDQKELVEIAKIAAAQKYSGISEFIQNYGIKDQKELIEIAKITAAQNGYGTSLHIQKYGITDIKELASIFLIATANSVDKTLEFLPKFRFLSGCLPELMTSITLLGKKEVNLSKVYESINSFTKTKNYPLPTDLLEDMQKKDPEIQRTLLLYLTTFFVQAYLQKINPDEFQFLIEKGFLKATLDYTNPKMRYQFIGPLIAMAKNEKAKEYVLDCLKPKGNANKKKSTQLGGPSYARLPLMLISSLYVEGVSHGTCNSQYEMATNRMFRPGKDNKVYVNTLYTIFSDDKLSTEDKENLLKEIKSKIKIESKSALVLLRSIQAIKDMNQMELLKKENLEKKTIPAILEDSIEKLIPIKKMENFSDQFSKYFGDNRVSNFIITYAAKLQADKKSLNVLGICLEGLLSGKFPDMRYDMTKSKHLKELFSEREELLNNWKKGEKVSLTNFLSKKDIALQPIDFHKIFCENLIDHKHLKRENAPLLFDFLESGKLEAQDKKSDDKLQTIQLTCIEIIDKELSTDKQKELLQKIAKDLRKLNKPEFAEFQNDIIGLLSGLSKRDEVKQSYGDYVVLDTDNYEDLFLSGTEVEGSCQRIDGHVSLNKCLMGYVFDGKNRLLAVKNKEGKIIARQIFRILTNGKEPLLFLERIYPTLVDPKLKQALEDFAISRAEELHLPLLTIDPAKPKYEGSILSLSTVEPILHEYSDAGDGHVTNGAYTISKGNVCYNFT